MRIRSREFLTLGSLRVVIGLRDVPQDLTLRGRRFNFLQAILDVSDIGAIA